MMRDIQDLIDYFANIATNHKDIAHTAADKRFYALDFHEIDENVFTNLKETCMILEYSNGSTLDRQADNPLDVPNMAFWIIQRAEYSDFTAKIAAKQTCKNIAFDILSRMRRDKRAGNLCSWDENSINYDSVPPMDDDFIGYRFTFNLEVPASLDYDSTKWLDS